MGVLPSSRVPCSAGEGWLRSVARVTRCRGWEGIFPAPAPRKMQLPHQIFIWFLLISLHFPNPLVPPVFKLSAVCIAAI